MSKETTHLHFANRIADVFANDPDNPGLGRLLESFRQALLWGAVSPDVFFYGLSARVGRISEAMHRRGAGSAKRRASILIRLAADSRHGELLAFTLGLVSHIVEDVWLHPAVLAFSGPESDPEAVRRHRLLETWLARRDSPEWSCARALNPDQGARLAGFHLLAPELATQDIRRVLRRFTVIHALLEKPWLHRALSPLKERPPRAVKELLALMPAHAQAVGLSPAPELLQDIDRRQEMARRQARELFVLAHQVFLGRTDPAELDKQLPAQALDYGVETLPQPCQSETETISFPSTESPPKPRTDSTT
jgi:hypothetical protein